MDKIIVNQDGLAPYCYVLNDFSNNRIVAVIECKEENEDITERVKNAIAEDMVDEEVVGISDINLSYPDLSFKAHLRNTDFDREDIANVYELISTAKY